MSPQSRDQNSQYNTTSMSEEHDSKGRMHLLGPSPLKQSLSYSSGTALADYFSQESMAGVTATMPVLNFVLCCNFYLFEI